MVIALPFAPQVFDCVVRERERGREKRERERGRERERERRNKDEEKEKFAFVKGVSFFFWLQDHLRKCFFWCNCEP